MSATNGRDLKSLREEYQRVRLEQKIARARAEAQVLSEAYLPGYSGVNWDALVSPFGGFRDLDFRGLPIGNRDDRRDGLNKPFVWHDLDMDNIRGMARWAEQRNPLMQGALLTLRNFTIKTGYTWDVQPGRGLEQDAAAKAIASQVQDVIDETADVNLLSLREREAFYWSRVDGDDFTRSFDQGDGTTLFRTILPEQVRQPIGSPRGYEFGIRTDDDDIETVIGYAVSYGDPDEWEEVPAEDVAHLKLNVPRCVKRGVSDLFSTGEAAEGAWKMLRNLRVTGSVQAAIPWIEQFEGATGTSVREGIARARDLQQPIATDPITGKEPNVTRYEAGTIPRVGKGRVYVPQPSAGNVPNHVQIVQSTLRAVGARWSMPEFMISGDASNQALASTLVAGSPFVTAIECEQDVYLLHFLKWRWIAVRNAARAGRFRFNGRIYSFAEVQRLVDIHGTAPLVAIANKQQDATIDQGDIDRGVMSLQARRAKLGLDNDKMRQEIAEEPPRQVAQQQGNGQQQGGGISAGFFPRLSAGAG